MSRHLAAVLLVSTLITGACGGDDDTPAADAALPVADAPGAVDAGPPDASPADAATSGRLTIEANGVTGASGKIVLVFVTATGGGPMLGAICAPVMADPGSVSGVAKVPSMANPCDLGAEVIFDNGSYDLAGGIYTPGLMTPDSCANTTVNVVGDTTATLPAFGACP